MSTNTAHPPALFLVPERPAESRTAALSVPPRVDGGLWRGLWFATLLAVPMWLVALWLVWMLLVWML